MGERVKHVNELVVGDIIGNEFHHHIKITSLPFKNDGRWYCGAYHVAGEYKDKSTKYYYLCPDPGFINHFTYIHKCGVRVRHKYPSMGDSKIKHYFM